MIYEILLVVGIIFIYMNIIFFLSLLKKDNSIIDIAWGLGFIVIALLILAIDGGYFARQLLITGLIILWGLRLSSNIFLRNSGRPEDFRYKAWRKMWKKNFFLHSYFKIFILQGIVMFFVSIPIVLVNSSSKTGLFVLDYIGLSVWLVGFFFESVGDYQLRVFSQNKKNKGKILQSGLWKFTRHPNYFGESVMWWGIFIIALSVENGFVAIMSPVLITYLLVYVSGIPLLEKKYKGNKKYEKYKEKTSSFIPFLEIKKVK